MDKEKIYNELKIKKQKIQKQKVKKFLLEIEKGIGDSFVLIMIMVSSILFGSCISLFNSYYVTKFDNLDILLMVTTVISSFLTIAFFIIFITFITISRSFFNGRKIK